MSDGFLLRAERLAAAIAEDDLQCLLVSAPANVRYLTGFSGSSGIALLLATELAASSGHLFLSDFRYELQAAEQVPDAYRCQFISSASGPRDLFEALAEQLQALPGHGSGYRRIGFEPDQLTVARAAHLERLLPDGWAATPSEGHVRALREIKEAAEIERIAAATELADEALRMTLQRGIAGRSERDIAIDLEEGMRRLGAEAASFPSIVASGAHGALPHAEARSVAVENGALVTIDWGAKLDGYCSDCTRTYAIGSAGELAREVYAIVLAAQQAALDELRPGICGSEIDAIARSRIVDAGYGEFFGHGLGHGVGLEVHEGPRLSPRRAPSGGEAAPGSQRPAAPRRHDDDQPAEAPEKPLQVGNVVTVEPGIYLPNQLGIRIEELVVLGEGASRVLTSLPRDLEVL